jgi:hypothetical protein
VHQTEEELRVHVLVRVHAQDGLAVAGVFRGTLAGGLAGEDGSVDDVGQDFLVGGQRRLPAERLVGDGRGARDADAPQLLGRRVLLQHL